MAKCPWFPFYPHDFMGDPLVLMMTCEERGAYIALLCNAWDPPSWGGERAPVGSLPNDHELLAALSGCGKDRWEEISDHVLRPFDVSEDGKLLVQKRMTQEAENTERIRAARREAGKRGGVAKASARQMPDKATPLPGQGSSNHKSQAQLQEEKPPAPSGAGRVSELLKRLDGQSHGAFVYSEPTKGQCIAIQRAAKKCGAVDWDNLGAYLAAARAGRGGEPLGTPLLASVLADRVEKSRRWKGAGCPSLKPTAPESFEEARKRKIAEEEARRPDLQPFVPPVVNEN